MKIGIDIDNVIADTFTDLIPYYNRFMGREDTPQEVIATMRRRKLLMVRYYFLAWRHRVMTGIKLIDGAAETLRGWAGEHQLKLVTSRLPLFNRQTREWLEKHQVPYHELHHAKETTKYRKAGQCEVFIEDNPEECEVLADHCERVFLFDQPWNRRTFSQQNIIRVNNWREIAEKL
jgi:uncharacterized HAD superfamily protein